MLAQVFPISTELVSIFFFSFSFLFARLSSQVKWKFFVNYWTGERRKRKIKNGHMERSCPFRKIYSFFFFLFLFGELSVRLRRPVSEAFLTLSPLSGCVWPGSKERRGRWSVKTISTSCSAPMRRRWRRRSWTRHAGMTPVYFFPVRPDKLVVLTSIARRLRFAVYRINGERQKRKKEKEENKSWKCLRLTRERERERKALLIVGESHL